MSANRTSESRSHSRLVAVAVVLLSQAQGSKLDRGGGFFQDCVHPSRQLVVVPPHGEYEILKHEDDAQKA